MKAEFIVSLDIPENVTISAMIDYINIAVRSDCGMLSPQDPLFYLKRQTVKTISANRTNLKIALKRLK